ncbi:MAG: cation:H+ antiporter [Maribacter sp.]|jgi:cation:H+ antiporter
MEAILLVQGLIFVVALAVLLKASDWFVESAEKIGLSFGISPFIIGVTIIAFGTSLPELASSIAGIIGGTPDIVIGNVVGSNITNIALVLGLVAIVAKKVPVDFKNMDIPLLIGSAILMYLMTKDQNLEIWESCILLACLVMFLLNTFGNNEVNDDEKPTVTWKDYALLIAGAALVALGAKFTIDAVVNICTATGLNSGFIGQTVVALGTSLPEIVVSLSAVKRGQSSIAVGNVIGSNIFNTYAVLGISRFFGPLVIDEQFVTTSIPIMMGMTVLLAFITLTSRITRWEGALLIIFYIFFLIQSILAVMPAG